MKNDGDDADSKDSTNTPCRKCGSLKLHQGGLLRTAFKISIPFSKFVPTDCVSISAVACLDCGAVELQVDPQKIKTILGINPEP